MTFKDKFLPRNREEGYEMFNQAIKTLENPSLVIEAAEHLDILFCLPELIDIGPFETESRAIQKKLSSIDEDLYEKIYNKGFAFAARSFESDTQEAAKKLGMFYRYPQLLRSLFDKIRFIDAIPDSWMDRFLTVGRLPELRVYDLHKQIGSTKGVPVSFARELYPSSFSAKLENTTLEVKMRGLKVFKDRSVYCGLFPIGSDMTFTRRSLSELSEEDLIRYGIRLSKGWKKVGVSAEDFKEIRKDLDDWGSRGYPIDFNAWLKIKKTIAQTRVCEFKVVKDEELIYLYPIESRSSLAREVLVLLAD